MLGRGQIAQLLAAKWERQLNYRLATELCAYGCDRIAVRFACQCRYAGRRVRAYCNENWECEADGLMKLAA